MNRVDDPWTELGVNWNNQPGGNSGSAVEWTVPLVAGCTLIDVKDPVQNWVDGSTNQGWRITDQGEDGGALNQVSYVTREDSVPGLRPTLNVTYTLP
jgi:hypothetical protein